MRQKYLDTKRIPGNFLDKFCGKRSGVFLRCHRQRGFTEIVNDSRNSFRAAVKHIHGAAVKHALEVAAGGTNAVAQVSQDFRRSERFYNLAQTRALPQACQGRGCQPFVKLQLSHQDDIGAGRIAGIGSR